MSEEQEVLDVMNYVNSQDESGAMPLIGDDQGLESVMKLVIDSLDDVNLQVANVRTLLFFLATEGLASATEQLIEARKTACV
jgi:hypothetical protein